jgi:TP901 family phage tail tape measure protein
MIGGGIQKITVEIGGKVAASLAASVRAAQVQVSTFGRNVSRTMNDAAIAGKKGFKGIFDNALWQQAAVGATGITVALGASIKAAAKFEQSLTDISKTARLSQADTKLLGQEILRLTARNETNQSAEQLAAGIKTLVGAGLTLAQARDSIRGIGRVATATGSEITDVANTSYQLMQNLNISAKDVSKTFEVLAFAGKQGSFELKDMATYFPQVASSAQKLGIKGVRGAADLAAMLQIVRRGAADSSTAANNLVNLLEKLTGKDAVKNFKSFGVDIEKVVKDAQAKGLNPLEESLKVIQKITNGDPFKINKLFGDMQVKAALAPLLKDLKDFQEIRDESLKANGVIDEDYKKQLKTFDETLKSFRNSAERLGITLGNSLLPPLTSIAESITPVVEGFANFAAAQPGLATGIVAVVGALAGLVVVMPLLSGMVGIIGAIGAAIGAVMASVPLLAGIGTVFALVVPPIGLAAAAIAGVAALAFVVIRNWQPISGFFSRLWNQIVATAQSIGPRLLGIFAPIPTAIIQIFTSSSIGQQIISSIINGLKARAGALFGWISSTIGRIRSMMNFGAPAAPAGAAAAGPTPAEDAPEGRARGGRVSAGTPYLVGERRAELFVPGMNGGIIPRVAQPITGAALAALLASPAAAAAPPPPAVTINAPITINATGGDPQQIRQHVVDAFAEIQHNLAASHRVLLND